MSFGKIEFNKLRGVFPFLEPEAGITIILMSEKSLSPEFEENLISIIQKARGDQPVVRIFPIPSTRQFAPEHQDSNK